MKEKKKKLTPVVKEILVDMDTPVTAFLKLQDKGAIFLLESVEKEERVGRYSIIGFKASHVLKIIDEKIWLNGAEMSSSREDFMTTMRDIFYRNEVKQESIRSPFVGGWIGYFGYGIARFFENIPSRLTPNSGLPEGIFHFVKETVIFDHFKKTAEIIALIDTESDHQKAQKRVEEIAREMAIPYKKKAGRKKPVTSAPYSNFTERAFKRAVERALGYIFAGDVFQVVLSQKFTGNTSSHPFDIYRMLRSINPSPYMFYLNFDDFQLIGSSPEALVKLKDGTAMIRPIAGTRPRGKTHEDDIYLARELLHDDKENAEHIMLVDLARNDLGKVCLPHSIKVEEKMIVERYSHVMHLVSEVKGSLNPGCDALELFKAAFPAGTVTGAPKIRAMEIIEELEKEKRGPYSGAVGYFGLDGNTDLCIAIRMIVFQRGMYSIQAGAGIVADSIPANEYRETLDKMAGMFQAVKASEELSK